MLIAVALFAFVSLVWPAVRKGMYGIKEVGVAEATQLMSHHDAVVLDVREDSEVAQGQIPKARHIPLGQLSARMGELEKFRDRPLVVNCRSGMRSARACVLLRKNKFEQVYNLAGGIIAWQQANMPVEKP
jgi:rhodanese-related sulfurtransferase